MCLFFGLYLGKSLSEALILASSNPQYDNRLFIELQVQYMKIPNLGRTCCVQKLFLTFRTIFVHNMFSSCSAKRRAFDKDLPVKENVLKIFCVFIWQSIYLSKSNFHTNQFRLMNLKVFKSSSYFLRFFRKFCYGLIYREYNRWFTIFPSKFVNR